MENEVRNILPGTDTAGQYLAKVWQYRALATAFAARELKVKYAGTYLGFTWLILYPLAMLAVYSLFFLYVFKINTQGTPYLLFAFSGLIPWLFFSSVLNAGSSMLLTHRDLIRKVYFPRVTLIIARVLVSSLEVLIMLLLYLAAAFYYGHLPAFSLALLPLAWLFGAFVAVAFALWTSALSFRFKDTSQFLPLIVNLFMWLTPVFYPVSAFPERFKFLAYLNPLTLVLDGYRRALLGTPLNSDWWPLSVLVSVVMFVLGAWFFIIKEDSVAENL